MNRRQERVLIVDDLEVWREQLVDVLRGNGLYADSAPTAAQALKRLETDFFHALVLDVRMNDADHTNVDGITMLDDLKKRHWEEAVQVIMLSAYGTKDQMRLAFKEHDVADFLSKDEFNNRAFLELMRQVFEQNVRINLDLDIQWQQVDGTEQAILHLTIDGTPVKNNTSLKGRMILELEDLLCRLFYNTQCIVARPLIPGHSGSGVLWVSPFYAAAGSGRAWVVKFGDLHTIRKEYHNFEEFVAPFVGGGRSTTALGMRCTPHLGGIIYAHLGATNEPLESLRHFYQHANIPALKEVFDGLFFHTCGAWYANPGLLRPYNLTNDYQRLLGYTQRELEQAVARLKDVQGKDRLFFAKLSSARNFTNPLQINRSFLYKTYECITHGDFNSNNILVDDAGHTWLIDFQSTGRGHILRDVATLESVVRFQLLTSEDATLDDRLTMEDALCSIDHFNQLEQLLTRLPMKNSALTKACEMIVHLRTIARRLVESNPQGNMDEYYVALFYLALNTLRFSTLNEVQREHALLSASLLIDRLKWSEENAL